MGLFFVPTDWDITDLEGDGQDEPWQLVHSVVGFNPVQVEFEHEHEDGDVCKGVLVEGHPMVLAPVKEHRAIGAGPARVYAGGDGLFFSTREEALAEAEEIVARLLAEQEEVDTLERMVHGDGAGDGLAAGD